MMVKDYDVVVVGAGNGGLIAAATTAQRGLKTLLIERHNIPGGCATSIKRGRFEFESAVHVIGGFGPPDKPGETRLIFEKLGIDAELVDVNDVFRSIVTGPGGYDVTMPLGIEAFIDKLEEIVPGSRESVTNFFSCADSIKNASAYMAQGKPDPMVMMSEHADFMRMISHSSDEVMTALGIPEKAQQILGTLWLYPGPPTGTLDGMYLCRMMDGLLTTRCSFPALRSHGLAMAIERKVRDYGGDIWYNTEVTKLLVENGAVTGVMTADGTEIRTKHVISNVIPSIVFGSMVEPSEVPVREIKKANARRFGQVPVTVYLGLNKSAEELGIEDYSTFICSTGNTNEQFRRSFSLEKYDLITVNCADLVVPGYSPLGACTLFFTKLYVPEAWEKVDFRDYGKLKQKIAADMIEQYEKATGIKIKEFIEEIVIAGPPTFARYAGTAEGNVYGYHVQPWDGIFLRTVTMAEEQTISGLRFCGSHSIRAVGYAASYQTGAMMAELTVKDFKEVG